MSASGRAKDMYAAIGEMVATWNGLEWDIAELFEELSSDRVVAHVVSAQLSSAALCDTLRAVAATRLEQELVKHVVQSIAAFERLRDYRNQFVHRVTAVLDTGTDAIGFTYGVRARKAKLMKDMGQLSASDLDYMMTCCRELSSYLTWIKAQVRWASDPDDPPPRAFRAAPSEVELMDLPRELPSRWTDWE